MEERLSRRKFLGGAAAAVAGTAALSGEAAARYIGQPIFTTDYIYIREGPGIDYDYIRTCDAYTGLEIEDGPVDADGWRWWKYYVNGDADDPTRVRGWGVESYTHPANFAYPTWGEIVSTYYDWRDFLGRYHEGCDIANDYGTYVRASLGGTAYAHWDDSYGYWVQIYHGNGWETRYAHLQDFAISDGQSVSQDEVIGYMGCTGDCWPKSEGGFGPHVHFEILKDGSRLNWEMEKNTHIWWGTGIERDFW